MVSTMWEVKGTASRSRVALRWQPARKQGTQSYNHKELNSANLHSWKWILPKASSEHPGWLTCWFQSYKTLSREPNWAHLDFWPTDFPDNKEVLFQATKLIAFFFTEVANYYSILAEHKVSVARKENVWLIIIMQCNMCWYRENLKCASRWHLTWDVKNA